MLPTLFVPTFLFALTATALPTTPSISKALAPRFDEAFTPSRCFFNPEFLGYKTKALTSRPAKAEVTITNKTTEEKGQIGSGLHDNLMGECGHDEITQFDTPTVLATSMWSNAPVAYSVWFNVGTVTDPACIERAIKKAEGQDVTCTPF